MSVAAKSAPDARTLKEALEQAYRERWAGTRSEKTTMSQAEEAVKSVTHHTVAYKKGDIRPHLVTVGMVDPVCVRKATADWYARGLSPATINKRLNCLSAMGISVEGCRVKNPKKLQWWLRPEDEAKVVAWLLSYGSDDALILADLVAWTTKTGLRIEESLRLRWSDFNVDHTELTVPGLKTGSAQATLAIGRGVSEFVMYAKNIRHFEAGPFPLTYEQAHEEWGRVRKEFGFTDPTATLKALRRSAARYLHYDRGMPLDMVRQYLRHENIETTMGYLRLTGGVSLDEQRRYLG